MKLKIFLLCSLFTIVSCATTQKPASQKKGYDGSYEIIYYQTTLNDQLSEESFTVPFAVENEKIIIKLYDSEKQSISVHGRVSKNGRLKIKGQKGALSFRSEGFFSPDGKVYGSYFARKKGKFVEGQFHGKRISTQTNVAHKVNMALFLRMLLH